MATGGCFGQPHSFTLPRVAATPDRCWTPGAPVPYKHAMLLVLLAALSAAIVAVMVRIGAIDHPVARSSHTTPTPKGGGVGIAASVALGLALVHPAGAPDGVLTAAAIGLAVASYLDDVLHWPFWLKLAAQIAASVLVVAMGFTPFHPFVPGLGVVHLGLLAPVLALGWLLFTTNAVNFMDGLNGLAAGSVAAGCLVFAARAGVQAAWPEAVVVAAVMGFLPFNYPAARIFMGDVGSQFLGFLVAGLALRHAGDPALSGILPLSLLPMLMDVAATLTGRWRAGARLTQAHRGHFYQMAHRAGVPAWLVSGVYWAMSGWAGACGAAMGGQHTGPVRGTLFLCAAIVPIMVWCAVVIAKSRKAGIRFWETGAAG